MMYIPILSGLSQYSIITTSKHPDFKATLHDLCLMKSQIIACVKKSEKLPKKEMI